MKTLSWNVVMVTVTMTMVLISWSKASALILKVLQDRSIGHHHESSRNWSSDALRDHNVTISKSSDILAPNRPHIRSKRAASSNPSKLWDNAVIPYQIDPTLPRYVLSRIEMAIDSWERHTCIAFVNKAARDLHYLDFTIEKCGCCTPVGCQRRGRQYFSVPQDCTNIGTIMHELGHTIGFYHEQSRPDRDSFIRINMENISPDRAYNFQIHNDIDSMNETYDFQSIMHYRLDAYAKGTEQPMTVLKNVSRQVISTIGQRHFLSSSDIRQANKLYKCPECGKTLLSRNATFGTPEFDTNSTNTTTFYAHKNCQWNIKTYQGVMITLRITGARIPRSNSCSSYLEIRDGHSLSPVIERICEGNTRRKILHSTGRRLFVEFNQAAGVRRRPPGFIADYRLNCKHVLRASSGNFSTPMFPSNYPPDMDCTYLLISPGSTVILLSFVIFTIESSENCDDFVEVRDGRNETSPLIGRYCGSSVPAIKSSSNHLFIRFKSDDQLNFQGFNATFKSVQCDRVIKASTGNITSPGYPNKYPPNINCTYLIVSPGSTVITLDFSEFSIESARGCASDYLEIRDGDNEEAPLMRRTCSFLAPSGVRSTSNRLFLKFHSNDKVEWQGFEAAFKSEPRIVRRRRQQRLPTSTGQPMQQEQHTHTETTTTLSTITTKISR